MYNWPWWIAYPVEAFLEMPRWSHLAIIVGFSVFATWLVMR